MKYDVFISYSRKDMAVADRICKAFDDAGIKYFIDRQGIDGGFEFPKVLAENIINSKLFLFLASENLYNSKFTTSEIVFAFNKKSKNSILPYIVDDSTMPLDLELVFAGVNWRNINEHPIETTLVVDVLRMLGREDGNPAEPGDIGDSTQPRKPFNFAILKKVLIAVVVLLCVVGAVFGVLSVMKDTADAYKIGDYYDDGIKQGVVFEVSADGKHGKIVSLMEAGEKLSWFYDGYNRKNYIGADDKFDGSNNMAKVLVIEDWRTKYPAFAWCASLGNGWYLPAIEELKKFTLDKEVYDAVNRTLATKGKQLADKDDWYWSSTEDGVWAWIVDVSDGYANGSRKRHPYCVRAVTTF